MDDQKIGPSGPEAPMPEGEEHAPRGVRTAAIVRWAIVGAVALVAIVTVGRSCMSSEDDASRAAETQTRYTCPMHPQIVQDGPGSCPICGMDLVPIAAAAPPSPEADGGTSAVPGLVPVTLSEDRLRASGIRTTRAVDKALGAEVRATGVIGPDERRLAEVTARVPGWLGATRAATIGDRVRRGQLLATIDSPEVLAASRELLSVRQLGAVQALTGADLTAPVRQKLELLGVPRGQIERIERSGQPSGLIPIAAPIAGHVIARSALPGGYVDRGTPIYQIADLSNVWVQIDVYARDLGRIEVGQTALVELEGGAAPPAEGRVTYLYPTSDAATRTTRVRVELANPDLRIRPGLFATVRIQATPILGVVVPFDAVVDTGDQQYCFVARGGGRFEPRRVVLGTRAGDEILIEEGLAAGDEVVTGAAFLLDSESRLRSAQEAPEARP
jgi:Cu(I)/Ag(I) efflux system membrane fusion protein